VLERNFVGAGLRWTHQATLGGRLLTLTTGADYDGSREARKGYINNFGSQGALKRDEDNTVYSLGGYLQGEWQALEKLSLSAGIRYTTVKFDSTDHFVCTAGAGICAGATAVPGVGSTNPDDSGSVSYSAWTPVAGVLYRASSTLNFYANAGRSFETPTFIELAYRTNGSGLNFNLRPALSNQYEVGAKAFVGANTRVDLALFQINTSDEIVVESNSGGRATYQNADSTRRRGVELALDSYFGSGWRAYVAATYMDASFQSSFLTCPSPAPSSGPPCPAAAKVMVPAGNTIPAIPNFTVYGELSWRYEPWGLTTGAELRWQGKAYVNDANSQYADPFTVVNLRAGLEQSSGRWRLQEFARIDNVFSEQYIGGIVVNDGNGRYYAPAPTRSFLLGMTAAYQF
jgi:iron complex outermembrane receptor protein